MSVCSLNDVHQSTLQGKRGTKYRPDDKIMKPRVVTRWFWGVWVVWEVGFGVVGLQEGVEEIG